MPAPVVFKSQTSPDKAELWKKLNAESGGNPDLAPLVIKAAYTVGHIYTICGNVDLLVGKDKPNRAELWPVGYLAACGVFASGLELLGQCVTGSSPTNPGNLLAGLKYLIYSDIHKVSKYTTVVTTEYHAYSIVELNDLRNYLAHNQATDEQPGALVDYGLLDKLLPLLVEAVARYWQALKEDEETGNKLAVANVIPLYGASIQTAWKLFETDDQGNYPSVESLFSNFNWAY